jgi:hypothetical protein
MQKLEAFTFESMNLTTEKPFEEYFMSPIISPLEMKSRSLHRLIKPSSLFFSKDRPEVGKPGLLNT